MIAQPLYYINATAPIRICDNGGWTDTWFAEYGRVFNIAVSPLVTVQIACYKKQHQQAPVTIFAENFGDQYMPKLDGTAWEKHPLIEAALVHMGIPKGLAIELYIYSEAPAGASTGTSAAVSIALLAALATLNQRQFSPYELADAAHHIETKMLKQQSGIQDQLASAFGGINLIEMTCYPQATVTPILLADSVKQALDQRLLLIYLGKPHKSSDVHEKVIGELEDLGPTARQLVCLRKTAVSATHALKNGDFAAFGQSMIANNEAQRDLNPALISPQADQIIALCQEYDALGWKVNGAGGDGGSITILGSASAYKNRQLVRAIEAQNPAFKNIPIRLHSHGVQAWRT